MTKKIIYWAATVLLCAGMLAGGLAQLIRQPQTVEGITHLGYPVYFMGILGTWKILGVIALLVPGFGLVKEWAYAGFFFAMTGAVISHIASGDGFGHFAAPLVFVLLTAASWYFRPLSRRFSPERAPSH